MPTQLTVSQRFTLAGALATDEGKDLLGQVDAALAERIAANAAEPYIHADYAAADAKARRLLHKITGSRKLADDINELTIDCGENVTWTVRELIIR
jgi:hypothetical protein